MGTARKAFYWFARGLCWLFLRLAFRWRVEGVKNIPRHGGCIVYANHISWYDILVLGCSVPRQVQFMAKAELFRKPIVGPVLRGLGAFPVNRHSADRSAVKHALQLLKDGGVLGIFPEGTRSKTGQLQPAEPGFAYLAYKSGVPMVPMGISSPYRLFGPVIARIGRPLRVTDLVGEKPTSEELNAASQRLMQEVGALLITDSQQARIASSR